MLIYRDIDIDIDIDIDVDVDVDIDIDMDIGMDLDMDIDIDIAIDIDIDIVIDIDIDIAIDVVCHLGWNFEKLYRQTFCVMSICFDLLRLCTVRGQCQKSRSLGQVMRAVRPYSTAVVQSGVFCLSIHCSRGILSRA